MVAPNSEGGVKLARITEIINEHKILAGKSDDKRLRWADIDITTTGF